MSRVTESVRDSVRHSMNYNEQDDHESQSVENRNYYAMSEVKGNSPREYQQTYGQASNSYDQQRGNEESYIRQTPQPKPRQVPQQQNRGRTEQFPTYGYSHANPRINEKNSKFMKEVYKTASPGTASADRQNLIEEHTWTPNGKGTFFPVFVRFDFVRKLWWFPLVHDYHHNCSNSVFLLHVLDCSWPAVQ